MAPQHVPASGGSSAVELDRLRQLKVLIVADHASAQFGGEAALPLHYFRVMRKMGMDVFMLTHDRVMAELHETLGDDARRVIFIADNWVHKLCWRISRPIPARLAYFTTGFVSRTLTQVLQRRVARGLVRERGIDLVLQPMPVSPREPSLMYGVGAPVMIGPLNGNMQYPPAFRKAAAWSAAFEGVGRLVGRGLNVLFPGKRRALAILVANERTRQALPAGLGGTVLVIPENGVDLSLWRRPVEPADAIKARSVTTFVFMGRLVALKGVDMLLEAFARAREQVDIALEVLGDGPSGAEWRQRAGELGILAAAPGEAGKVFFAGWQTQAQCAARLRTSDALVLPSLRECGGAVVLEAMACGLPVVATAWGGPLDYLDQETGILVPATSREAMVDGLTAALVQLAGSRELRDRLGRAARSRVESDFDWDKKVIEVLATFDRLRSPPPSAA